MILTRLYGALIREGAQVPLAVFSFGAALALLVAALVAPTQIGGPVAVCIAALLCLNGGARLVLWRKRENAH